MTQAEFVAKMVENTGVTESLKSGEKVSFTGFGSFEVTGRPAREGRNPQTGETLQLDTGKAHNFNAGKGLKDAVA